MQSRILVPARSLLHAYRWRAGGVMKKVEILAIMLYHKENSPYSWETISLMERQLYRKRAREIFALAKRENKYDTV